MSDDRFVREKKVGEGGMGEVYLARDEQTGRKVALKVLSREGVTATGSDRLIERFFAECTMLASLRHPHIVRYVAHGRLSSGEPFLAMQWLEGVVLAERLAEGRMPLSDALTLALAVSEALAFAHARGIVHRDLKPSNLLLVEGEPSAVQVLDFGVARAPGGSGTQPGTAIGTPGYMAPEQIRGLPTVGPSADVYAVGAVLFEMIAGRPPFVAKDPLSLLGMVLLEEPPSLAQYCQGLPAALVRLVGSMLDKDPSKRPADGTALRRALEALPSLSSAASIEAPPQSITSAEQRLVPVVLIRDPGLVSLNAAVDADGPTSVATLDAVALAATLAPIGCTLRPTSDGFVATIDRALGVPDLFVLAARAALAVRRDIPFARLAVGAITPGADVVSEADLGVLQALIEATLDPRVVVDDLGAGMLDALFVVVRVGRGRFLERERDGDAGRRLLGQETPFVGRDAELSALEELLRSARATSSPRAAVLHGEAGVGKTRLRQELVRRASEFGAWLGRADPARWGSPFALAASLVANAAGLRVADQPALKRTRLLALMERVRLADDACLRVAEFLGELVGAAFEPSVQLRAARRDPQLKHDQLRRAFEDLVAAASSTGPLLIVLEDLQWADAGSMHLVEAALRHAAHAPIVVLATARAGLTERLGRPFGWLTPLERTLLPLTANDAARIVRTVMPSAAVETASRLVAASGGHPLHLEELIRAHAGGTGVDTVKVMLVARLSGLASDVRRVLRAASVVGPRFTSTLVRAQCPELTDARLRTILGDLVRQELIIPSAIAGDELGELEFVFATTLLCDATYGTLTEGDRLLGHFLVASALATDDDADPLALAEHWVLAGDRARAAIGFLHAAERALDGNDLDGALGLVRRGLEGDEGNPLSGALLCIEARVHRWRSANEEMSAAAERAVTLLPEGTGLWFEALADAGVAASRLGRVEALTRHAEALSAMAPDDSHLAFDAKLLAISRIAIELRHAGKREEADAMLASLAEGEARFGTEPSLAAARAHAFAVPALIAGDLEAAYRLLTAAAQAFATAGDLRHECIELANAGFLSIELGVPEYAETALRSALASSRRLSVAAVESGARATLALALVRLGRPEEGYAEAQGAFEVAHAQSNLRLEGAALLYRALAEVALGAHEAAADTLRKALAAFAAVPAYRAYTLGVSARLALRRGALGEAGQEAREAMSILGRLGGLEAGEALVRLAFVEVLAAEGRTSESQRARAIGRERLSQRAARIVDPALRGRFLAIPEHRELVTDQG